MQWNFTKTQLYFLMAVHCGVQVSGLSAIWTSQLFFNKLVRWWNCRNSQVIQFQNRLSKARSLRFQCLIKYVHKISILRNNSSALGLRAVLTEVLAFANCTPPYLITRSQWNQQKVFPELTQSMLKLAVEQLIIWNKLFGEVPSQRVCQIEVKGVCEDYVVYTVHCTGQLGVHWWQLFFHVRHICKSPI